MFPNIGRIPSNNRTKVVSMFRVSLQTFPLATVSQKARKASADTIPCFHITEMHPHNMGERP
jgi:hypothetical protein